MQYSHLLTILAGAAAVSAGLTDSLVGNSLTGSATGDADAQAKGGLSGLPTDELLSGVEPAAAKESPKAFKGKAANASDDSASDSGDAEESKKGSILDNLGLKQMLKPTGYPYEDPSDPKEDPSTSTYYEVKPTPTPTFVTKTVTKEIPTVTAVPSNNDTSVNNSGVESCSEGTATSCCDTKAASDGLLSNILGGSCALSNLQVPVIGAAISGSQCNNGNTFCCPINQDGNLNIALACIPINL
jgi:hypothetical protein